MNNRKWIPTATKVIRPKYPSNSVLWVGTTKFRFSSVFFFFLTNFYRSSEFLMNVITIASILKTTFWSFRMFIISST